MSNYTPVEIAKDVNEILSDYIDVNDYMFSFSIRKIIPIPLFFKKVDTKKVKGDLEIVLMNLEICLSNLNTIPREDNYSSDEHKFIQKLDEYIQCLLITNSALYNLADRLDQKVERTKVLSYKEFDVMVDNYKKSIKVYTDIGVELNGLYHNVK